MRVGVPKEIKVQEHRVGLTPMAVREYAAAGHEVLVQAGAGAGIGADDAAYVAAGARIVASAAEVFAKADMIVKVKEPQAVEWKMLRDRADPVHLPAPRARPRAGARAAGFGLHRSGLRDRHRRARRPAAAGADERSGRAPGDRGGGVLAAQAGRRQGPAARRRARRAAGARGGGGRRRRRHARGAHGRGPRRRGDDPRPLAAAPAPARRAVPGPRTHALLERRRTSRKKCSSPTWWSARC